MCGISWIGCWTWRAFLPQWFWLKQFMHSAVSLLCFCRANDKQCKQAKIRKWLACDLTRKPPEMSVCMLAESQRHTQESTQTQSRQLLYILPPPFMMTWCTEPCFCTGLLERHNFWRSVTTSFIASVVVFTPSEPDTHFVLWEVYCAEFEMLFLVGCRMLETTGIKTEWVRGLAVTTASTGMIHLGVQTYSWLCLQATLKQRYR